MPTIKTHDGTDFTEDLKKFDVPTLIIHLASTRKDQLNADLLAFIGA